MDTALVIAIIASIASVVAAAIAAFSAISTRREESRQARLQALEERLAHRRSDVYQPMIEAMGDMLIASRKEGVLERLEPIMADFMNLAPIWASDDLMRAFFRWRMGAGTLANPTPLLITMRLTGDLLLAFRRDIAGTDTTMTPLEVFGMRLNDLSTRHDVVEALTMPWDDLVQREGWQEPWAAFGIQTPPHRSR